MIRLLVAVIKGYQRFVSPLLGNRCRFYPSCSSYAIHVLQYYGLFKGMWMTLKRLCRCHPYYSPKPSLPVLDKK